MPIVSSVAKSLPPSGTASGDLSGTYPGPTVAAINGVGVTGTAASGKVIQASSASAASWQTPATPAAPTLAAVLTTSGDPDGHAITGAVTVVPVSTGAIGVQITPPVGSNNNALEILDKDTHSHRLLFVNEVGEFLTDTNNSQARIKTNDNGTITLEAGDSGVGYTEIVVSSFDNIYNYLADNAEFQVLTNASAAIFRVLESNGVVIFKANAAPADGSLAAGECAIWFDSTNAAAAFNIKAKQANGTVKTATIPVIT